MKIVYPYSGFFISHSLINYYCQVSISNEFVLHFLLHGAGMLAYKTISGTKSFKKGVHLTLQFLSFILSVIGVWAALKFHNDKGIDNFYSLHSWMGLTCVFLFAAQVFTLYFFTSFISFFSFSFWFSS